MKFPFYFLLRNLLTVLLILIKATTPSRVEMDEDDNFILNWQLTGNHTINFTVSANTKGWVGFGISEEGTMHFADIFIAGVKDDGTLYSSDRFGIGNEEPRVDKHQDWTLLHAEEKNQRTYLNFSRLLNSCDREDKPIKNGNTQVIWAMGKSDKIAYHSLKNRGSKSITLITGNTTLSNLDDVSIFPLTLNVNVTIQDPEFMPADARTHFCSFHVGPKSLKPPYNILGFETLLPNPEAEKYLNHLVLYNCYINGPNSDTDPDSKPSPLLKAEQLLAGLISSTFSVESGFPSVPCTKFEYVTLDPKNYCTERIYVWPKGGKKKFTFPENFAYPIGQIYPKLQYYMIEIHYNNYEDVQNIKFETGVVLYYTKEKRKTETGLLLVGYDVARSNGLIVPYNTSEYSLSGHCGSNCTDSFPVDGITVFSSLLDSHLWPVEMTLRQFRNGVELEWIDEYKYSAFNHHENKELVGHKKILPGDHLTLECRFSSPEINVSAAYSRRDEACQAYLWYYPRMNGVFGENGIDVCTSYYNMTKIFKDLGITNYSYVMSDEAINATYVINEPKHLAGNFLDTLTSDDFEWSPEMIDKLEQERNFGKQEGVCAPRNAVGFRETYETSYLEDIKVYISPYLCYMKVDGTTEDKKAKIDVVTAIVIILEICILLFMACRLILCSVVHWSRIYRAFNHIRKSTVIFIIERLRRLL